MNVDLYVLIRGFQVLSVNWAGHGKKGVYIPPWSPEPGDQIVRVRTVKKKSRKKPKT